jgi:hypothetical protein
MLRFLDNDERARPGAEFFSTIGDAGCALEKITRRCSPGDLDRKAPHVNTSTRT